MTSTLGAAPTTNGSSTTSDGVVTQAKDAVVDKTAEVRRNIGTQVSERVRDQADQRSTMVGEHVSSIASALKDTASRLDAEGESTPAKALTAVTDRVERVGSYLTESRGDQLLHDVEDAARRRPWAMAAALFGIGFAASRLLGASSKGRYSSRVDTTEYTPSPAYSAGAGAAPVVQPALGSGTRPLEGGTVNGSY
ncbi:MAG: hypothetical protein JWO69_693 [Thermoleophilia bacterium]|nr:hypothetical protein [Thermoleophilia bacterium]